MSSITNEPLLLRSNANGISTLTLNRGDKFNALSLELINSIQGELEAIAKDNSVRVVVIAGAGKAFCAGHDLVEMRADPGPKAMKELFKKCSKMMVMLTKIPQPVIARVHGTATAAGCQLVAQCDLAVAVEDATFATSGINIGLFCSTPMVAVTRNLPRKQAMEMLMTGEFIDAETARQYGLVNRVVPLKKLDQTISELAQSIADKSPTAISRGKELFYRQLKDNIEVAYEYASEVITANMQDVDARGGLDSFVNKRSMPDWKDR
ncbi:MAG: enoyl-CoA hydratase [Magnetovibrio sp.]|nr:enoyl-CoA hydratase [Magnetovibrio sp.]